MVRRADGNYEVTGRELRMLMVVLPALQLVFAAGAAWAGVRYGLEQKVDRAEFRAQAEAVRMDLFALHLNDSLLVTAQREQTERIREVVCRAVKGCR